MGHSVARYPNGLPDLVPAEFCEQCNDNYAATAQTAVF